eukprot:UN16109
MHCERNLSNLLVYIIIIGINLCLKKIVFHSIFIILTKYFEYFKVKMNLIND